MKNSNNFIVIDHSVNSAADLNIAMTLENYAASNDQDAFINALRGANIPNHAIALAILCQGYFAAHAQDHEAMKEIIKIFDDEWLGAAYKKKVETESNDWWNIIETSEVRKKIPQDTDADLDNLLLLIAEGKNISDSHMVISSYKAISKAIGL